MEKNELLKIQPYIFHSRSMKYVFLHLPLYTLYGACRGQRVKNRGTQQHKSFHVRQMPQGVNNSTFITHVSAPARLFICILVCGYQPAFILPLWSWPALTTLHNFHLFYPFGVSFIPFSSHLLPWVSQVSKSTPFPVQQLSTMLRLLLYLWKY